MLLGKPIHHIRYICLDIAANPQANQRIHSLRKSGYDRNHFDMDTPNN
jgi:hypothetical protein